MNAEYQGNEGFLQRDSVEHKGYAEVQSTDRREGRERDSASDLLEAILDRNNLNRAYKRVKRNHGAAGIDGMTVMAERHLPLAVTNEVQVIHALEEVFEVALLDPVPVVVSDDEVLFALELLQVLFGRLLVSEQQVAKNIDGIAVGNLGIPVSD